MREGEMLDDLVGLLRQRNETDYKCDIDDQIVLRHAYPWYDGEADKSDRWLKFKYKVHALIPKCAKLVDDPDKLSEMWINGILAVEEGHVEKEPLMERLDGDDLVRHWLNGGTHYGFTKNIHGQINKIAEKDLDQVMRVAKARFESE